VSPRELLVLIIRDHGLRSSLIGRLSLRGENLLTIERDPQDPELARLARPPAILIIDTEILGDRLPALRQGSHWEAIVVLAPSAETVSDDNRVRVLDRQHALAQLTETLDHWREQQPE